MNQADSRLPDALGMVIVSTGRSAGGAPTWLGAGAEFSVPAIHDGPTPMATASSAATE
jgi:hypothetical protein